jgi:hypothetical protein
VNELWEGKGWIGGWTPKIGDPTPVGWLTVVCYFVACVLAVLVFTKKTASGSPERRFWILFGVLLLGLGINKQLDLQTALTEAGRVFARAGGWYDARHRVQRRVIVLILACGLAFGVYLMALLRRAPLATLLSAFGGVVLFIFVAIRAVSFHHFDGIISSRILGAKMNWLLELGGLAIVSAGALWRIASSTSATHTLKTQAHP